MTKFHTITRAALALALVTLVSTQAQAQDQGGVFTAGDLWETFLPTNVAKSYRESGGDSPDDYYMLIRVGNLDRQWTTPSMTYPGGENIHLPWEQQIQIVEYNPDADFNPYARGDDANKGHFAYGFFLDGMAGAERSTFDAGAHWVDDNNRHVQMYEGLTPTNLGIDVQYRIRQYSINTANLNDFIAIEMGLTNTGEVDIDADGTVDRSGNRINALTLSMRHEPINSMTNGVNGRRGASGWITGPASGYDATPDADGNPWDVPVIFTGPTNDLTKGAGPDGVPWAADGSRRLGATMNSRGIYYDIYAGFQFIAAKEGALPASGSSAGQPDKMTIYDSHPVGAGAERGWYTTVEKDSDTRNNAMIEHRMSMGVWFDGDAIGNRGDYTERDTPLQSLANLKPDPNWFDPNDADIVNGDPLSFIDAVRPEGERGQPRGDMKYNGTFIQNWEKDNASNWANAPEEAADWDEGFSIGYNFDGKHRAAIGPFALEVGETMNVTLIEYGGFRLQGVRKARKAGQWAYDNNWNVPAPPPSPEMLVAPNVDGRIDIKWDDRAQTAADFAGYKVYRSTPFPNVDSQQLGSMRLADTYHLQTTPNMSDANLAALGIPNNPNISSSGYKQQEPNASGPYHLIANIPASELGRYSNPDAADDGYDYVFEDDSDLVAFGFTYYYYVAAYDNQSGTVVDQPFTSLESHRVNFNGRTGLWEQTFHYATANVFFPEQNDIQGRKDIGAAFVLKSPLVSPAALQSGVTKIRVTPNPYKVEALHDTGLEHKILFSNLPTGVKVTILDVSGQIIDVLRFEGTNPADGTIFWDMFSKDGIEVTSGLYIYVAEYPGGTQTGHFAILR